MGPTDRSGHTCPLCGHDAPAWHTKNEFSIHKCASCGLGHIDPVPDADQLIAYYNDGFYRTGHVGYREYAELEAGLRRMYFALAGRLERDYGFALRQKAVLDVGCAYGFFLDVAKECGASELWGTDVTSASADVLREKRYRFLQGPFERITLPRQHFDLVFMGDVVEHLHDPFLAMAQLREILKPDGMVVLTTVDFDSWFVRLAGSRWRLLIPPIHTYYWTKRSVDLLFRRYGFTGSCTRYTLYVPKRYLIERFEAQFGFAPTLARFLPVDLVPVRSFDTMRGIYRRRAGP